MTADTQPEGFHAIYPRSAITNTKTAIEIDGTGGDDAITITLSAGPGMTAVVNAGGGADSIDTSSDTASVTITAGSGDDTILTGDGDDSIDAGDGDDYVDAGNGNDTILGGVGADSILAGDGNDSGRWRFGIRRC